MTVPATLIRIATGEVLIRGLLPVAPTEPVPGLDPELQWLIDYEPFAPRMKMSRCKQWPKERLTRFSILQRGA